MAYRTPAGPDKRVRRAGDPAASVDLDKVGIGPLEVERLGRAAGPSTP